MPSKPCYLFICLLIAGFVCKRSIQHFCLPMQKSCTCLLRREVNKSETETYKITWIPCQTAAWHHHATFGPYLVLCVNASLKGSRASLLRSCRLIRASRIRSNCTQIYTNGAFSEKPQSLQAQWRERWGSSGGESGGSWLWWKLIKWCLTTELYSKAAWIFEQTARLRFSISLLIEKVAFIMKCM